LRIRLNVYCNTRGVRALAITGVSIVLVGAAWSRGPDGSSRPEVRLVKIAPVTVAGTGFVARERVRVVLRAGRWRPTVRSVQATPHGSFRFAFDVLVAVEPCEGTLLITATGSRGSSASWKRGCRPPSRRPPSGGE
jgi:hypothetical protein